MCEMRNERDELTPSDEAYVQEMTAHIRVGDSVFAMHRYSVCIDDLLVDDSITTSVIYTSDSQFCAVRIAEDWNSAGTADNDVEAWVMIQYMLGRFDD